MSRGKVERILPLRIPLDIHPTTHEWACYEVAVYAFRNRRLFEHDTESRRGDIFPYMSNLCRSSNEIRNSLINRVFLFQEFR